ncbi:riboflavin kinase [Candidatus Nomurabacteria bacterium]|nr:riboflavin kinase [Candidatus Nomurabacteria bacterium]
MIFHTKQVKGQGRGHAIGFPTINLIIPTNFEMDYGIYAVWVVINDITFKGALHYGPVPTFNQNVPSMEVYLLDVTDDTVPNTEDVEIEIDTVQYLRLVKTFDDVEDLMNQIAEDVQMVSSILK